MLGSDFLHLSRSRRRQAVAVPMPEPCCARGRVFWPFKWGGGLVELPTGGDVLAVVKWCLDTPENNMLYVGT